MAKTPTVNLADIIDEAELTTYTQTREQEGPKVARDVMLGRWQKELDKSIANMERQREAQTRELWGRLDSFWGWFRWVIIAAAALWILFTAGARGCASLAAAAAAEEKLMAEKGFISLDRQEPGTPIKGAPTGVKFVSASLSRDDKVTLIIDVPPPPEGKVYSVSYALQYSADDPPEVSGLFVTDPRDAGILRFEKEHTLRHLSGGYNWISVAVSLSPAR